MIIRVNKTKNYTVMSNAHLQDKRLSLKAKGLLSMMLSLSEEWNYSVAGLAAISKENETAIKTALGELKVCGYLVITKKMPHQTRSGRIEYEYDIYELPQTAGKQEVEKQEVENLPLENQGLENLGQLNTKELNTKELSTKEENTNEKSADALPSTDAASLEAEFDILWKLYPRKEGKSNALKDYIKARKDKKNPVTMEEVQRGIERYVKYITAAKTERRFIKQGSTWFHQRCWEDEYQGVNTDGGSKGDSPKARIGNYI